MKKLFPRLNTSVITDKMVQTAARKLKTKIYFEPLGLDGYFIPASISLSGKQEIYINTKLSPERSIAACVHELTHAAVDVSSNAVLASHQGGLTAAARRDRDRLQTLEFAAYAISAIALIPEPKLIKAERGLFDVGDEFLDNLWSIRMEVQERYGDEIRT